VIALREHLMNLHGDLLKGWARQMNLAVKGLTRKEQFAEAVESEIKGRLPAVLARATEAERQFLAECVHRDGELVSAACFEAKYGVACPAPSRSYSFPREVWFLTPFVARETIYGRSEETGIARDLVAPLRALLPSPMETRARVAEEMPATWTVKRQYFSGGPERIVRSFAGEQTCLVELERVLRLIQGGKVKVTESTRRPTEAAVRLIGEALIEPDYALEVPEAERGEFERKYYTAAGPVRAHAWPVVVQQCGWARPRGGVLALSSEGKALLGRFDLQEFRSGVDKLMDDSEFDELHRVNHIRGQTGKGKRWITAPSMRKRAILRAMRKFPVGQWLTFEEACRLMEASGEDYRVSEGERSFLYFFEPQYGLIYDGPGLRCQFLRAFFMETLATLGLVDIAYVFPHRCWPDLYGSLNGDLAFCGRYDGLLYVRINALGGCALGLTSLAEYRPPARPRLFQVLPNLDLVLTGPDLSAADRAGLERVAIPQNETVWKLDSERILSHLETGGTIASVRSYLEDNALAGLPDEATVLLDGLETRLTACRSRCEAVLLEWTTPALAQSLAASPGLGTLCHYAGENRIVVPGRSLAAFSRALKRMGYVLPGE
jgi:hypothetical protein